MIANTDKKNSKLKYWGILAFILVFILWGVSWYFLKDYDNRGTFGDMFGAINALFSGLAFAGLIVTLITQQEELRLQREELKLTRNELSGQKKEFEEQNKTLKQQRFENTFFNMLSLQQEIVAGLQIKGESTETVEDENGQAIKKRSIYFNGRIVFKVFYCSSNPRRGIKKRITESNDIYCYEKTDEINILDHYFRHLYRIVKYVHKSDLIVDKMRYDYMCILRAQLSDYELLMLFYNGLSSYSKDKFKPLIEEYALLKNIRFSLLAKEEHKSEYANGAYEYSREDKEESQKKKLQNICIYL